MESFSRLARIKETLIRHKFLAITTVILLVALPILLLATRQPQETRTRATAATSLSFVPSSTTTSPITKSVGENFSLDAMVDPANNFVSLAKIDIKYDSTKMTLDQTNPLVVNTVDFPVVVEGPIYTTGDVKITVSIGPDQTKVITVPTKVLTLNFKATTVGSTSVSYTTGTNALYSTAPQDSSNENVLSTTTPATIQITTAATGTSTPTPTTVAPSSPTTPTPTPFPTGANNTPIGSFDTLSCDVATGWTCDPDDWSAALKVHFYADGKAGAGGTFVGVTDANISREAAVAKLCGGMPTHGFRFDIPASIRDNTTHTLYAYAINIPTGTNPIITGSPKSLSCTPITPSPTPTPILSPIVTSPTPVPTPQIGILNFSHLRLHGIGKGGDTPNPNSTGTLNPLHPTRSITVEMYNTSGTLVTSAKSVIDYASSSGEFVGQVAMPKTLTAGSYIVKIKSPQYLRKQLTGFLNYVVGQNNISTVISLIAGDVDGDNALKVADYNIIMDCYSDLLPAKNCSDSTKKAAADLSDDGKVDQDDYNLFLRELSVQTGD